MLMYPSLPVFNKLSCGGEEAEIGKGIVGWLCGSYRIDTFAARNCEYQTLPHLTSHCCENT
jgi:hypothetical protein